MPHIVCCVKQVPDPEAPASQFKVDEAARRVLPVPGVQPVPSQFDTIGVEAALRIKDKVADTTITILTLGPDSYRDAIKHCLAMGADEGVHINDPALNDADHWATAETLAAAIKGMGPVDLIIVGRQAVDWDMGVVGSTIAEILDMPVITIAKDVQMDGGKVTVERVLLDGFETMEAPTPCVVTVSNELGEPRYPQLRQIMQAAKKEVKAMTAAEAGVSAANNRVTLEALFVPETKVETQFIEADSGKEAGEALAVKLREEKLI